MCSSIHEPLRTPGYRVKKGEEIGIFQFGGSSIIVSFEKDRIIFDQDLEDSSMKRIMVDVEVGMSLGRASKS
jgi:phosphatidylserine decarboxylase